MSKKARRKVSAFELIAHRYETGSLIITSNQPFNEWDKIFTDSSMTVAAIDRVVHHSIIIEVEAQSYRKREALHQNNTSMETTLK
jgi:DNA replication protein DnaC